MATATLSDPIFHDADAARAHFEKLRWPDGRVCPHCGVVGDEASTLLKGKSHRAGLYKCKACDLPFTATIGTVYEDSKVPLNKWLLATHLMCASKKGISAHQLFRMLGFGSYRTAWFMAHRIREAMNPGASPAPLGGTGKVVLAGTNTYTGATLLGAATTEFSGGTQTLSGVVSGAGALINSGSGTLTLSVANAFTGGTTINGGRIVIGHASSLGTGAAIVGSGGALDLAGFTATNALSISGTGDGTIPAIYNSSATTGQRA